MIEPMHFDQWLNFLAAGVVARPFAEWPLFLALIWQKFTFNGDLCVGGDRQSGKFPGNHFDRFALETANGIELAPAVGFRSRRDHMQQWIDTETAYHRTGFALVKIFLPVQPAMLSRRDVHAHGIAVVHHDPVTADVDPTFVGIAGDYHVTGANVTPAVALVPARHGKFEKIDVVAGKNIFHHRSG